MLLADLLSREIDDSLLDVLRLPDVRGVVERAAPEAAPYLEADWDRAKFEEHAIEFCRLFIYPAVCPPRADPWVKDCGEEHFSIRRWFAEGGIPEFSPRIAELPDTHVAKILVVRAGLADADAQTITAYESQMIQPWATTFADALGKQSQLPIYQAAAAIIAALV